MKCKGCGAKDLLMLFEGDVCRDCYVPPVEEVVVKKQRNPRKAYNNLPEKTCAWCNNPFPPSVPQQKYCTKSCAKTAGYASSKNMKKNTRRQNALRRKQNRAKQNEQ